MLQGVTLRLPLCVFPAVLILLLAQMTSDSGHSNLLTDKTGSDLWRLVRKGVAPAFNPQNIRSVSCSAEASALLDAHMSQYTFSFPPGQKHQKP